MSIRRNYGGIKSICATLISDVKPLQSNRAPLFAQLGRWNAIHRSHKFRTRIFTTIWISRNISQQYLLRASYFSFSAVRLRFKIFFLYMWNELKYLTYAINEILCIYVGYMCICRMNSMVETKMWLVQNPVRLMLIGAEIGEANNVFVCH